MYFDEALTADDPAVMTSLGLGQYFAAPLLNIPVIKLTGASFVGWYAQFCNCLFLLVSRWLFCFAVTPVHVLVSSSHTRNVATFPDESTSMIP